MRYSPVKVRKNAYDRMVRRVKAFLAAPTVMTLTADIPDETPDI